MAIASTVFSLLSTPASAANWFKLLNEPPTSHALAIYGYLGPTYTYTGGTAAANGQVPLANLIAPQFTSHNSFSMLYARLMARGMINKHISYFLGIEFGNNLYVSPDGKYIPKIINAAATFSYIPGVRIAAGVMAPPGSEAAMEGYMDYQFTGFSVVSAQLMLQPYYNPSPLTSYTPNGNGGFLVPSSDYQGIDPFRNTGVEATDWFRNGPWQFAYGAFVGNYGPPLASNESNGPFVAGRIQESYIFGGHGPFRSDITGFLWYQHANPLFNGHTYSLSRSGLGLTYMQNFMHPWGRWVKFEYMRGSGMITGPAAFNETANMPPVLYEPSVYPGSSNTANGYYVGGGLFVTHRLEVDMRYDRYDLLPNIPAQNRVFKTWAVGFQYHFTPLTRVLVDYYIRGLDIPHIDAIPPAGRGLAESISHAFDNEISVQAIIGF
ncbi:MAG: porin [Acidithiobacillus sp.]